MKTTKNKFTIFPLRFPTKAQRDVVKRAAKIEQRSMNNFILKTMLAKAHTTLWEAQLKDENNNGQEAKG
jgi:uncharacterized protein (DUF1778 family)